MLDAQDRLEMIATTLQKHLVKGLIGKNTACSEGNRAQQRIVSKPFYKELLAGATIRILPVLCERRSQSIRL